MFISFSLKFIHVVFTWFMHACHFLLQGKNESIMFLWNFGEFLPECVACSSSIGTTAHCGPWPVEQCPSIFPYLPPTLSISSLPALEYLFLLSFSIFSWFFPFFSSLPVLEWRSFWASYPPPFSLGDIVWHHIRKKKNSFPHFHLRSNSISRKSSQYLWFSLLRQTWFVWNRNRTYSGQIHKKIQYSNIRWTLFSFPPEFQLMYQRQTLTILL